MAGCTSNEAPVTDEGLWKDARPTGASLPYPRDTPTIIARHRTAGTSQQDDLGTAVRLWVPESRRTSCPGARCDSLR